MELYLPPPPAIKNKQTGHFLKGHTPHNKGKKWDEFLSKEHQKQALKNLSRKGNPNLAGWNKKEVIAIKNGKIFGVFKSANDAGRKLNLIASNIRLCCRGKRKRCGGIYWFWEADFDRWSKYITI